MYRQYLNTLARVLVAVVCILLGTAHAQASNLFGGSKMNKDSKKTVLMVVTSADRLLNGRETGAWLEELAVPYELLTNAGFNVAVASPKGGAIPLDPHSLDASSKAKWTTAQEILKNSSPLAGVRAEEYVAIFLPGGHGTMIDFPNDAELKRILHDFSKEDKVIAAVCHGPAGLVGAKGANGSPLVSGKRITAFTDAEEKAISLEKAVPFLLETKLREEGAEFVTGNNWASHVEVDGKLVTGQNPASSAGVAQAIIELLQ